MRDITIGLATFCAGLAMILLACGTPMKKTNAEKCAAMGGTYNAAARVCYMQVE